MKHILVIHHAKGLNGSLIALLELLKRLKPYYCIQVLCIYKSDAVEYIKEIGVDVAICDHWFYKYFYKICEHTDAKYLTIFSILTYLYSYILYFVNCLFFAPVLLRKHVQGIDMVYLNSTFLSDWSLGAKLWNKKVVLHVREPFSRGCLGLRYHIFRLIMFFFTDTIIAISKDNSRRVDLLKKTFVVYDDILSDSNRLLGEINLDKDYKYFLYLGGQARIKGFEQLVLSLPYLSDDIKIIFAGYIPLSKSENKIKKILKVFLDPYYLKLGQLYKILNESSNILLVGDIDNVLRYLQNCYALISPFSKPHASLPVMESFYVGRPVIVSDVVGMDEFADSSTGSFFANGSAVELANRINQLADLSWDELNLKYNIACKKKLHNMYSSSLPINEIVARVFKS